MIGGGVIKRTLSLTIILIFVLSFAGCGPHPDEISPLINTYKDIPGIAEDEISAIESLKAGRSKFTYGAYLATETFILPDNTYAGFSKKFCDLLSDLFGIDFVLEIYDGDELITDLEAGTLDFTGELTPTEERMQKYGMTLPIAERLLRIFTNVDANEIKTVADVKGFNIGFMEGSVTVNSIRNHYPVAFTCTEVDNYQTAAEMLKNGEIDAFIIEAVADPAFEKYDFIQSAVFFPMVHAPVSLTTANPDLAPVIAVVNRYIDSGGIDILYEYYKEGEFEYSKYKLYKSFTNEEKAYIDDLMRSGSVVPVGYEHDNYPVDFYNTKEDEFQGIAVDVLAEVSRLTDIRFEPAVSKNATWAQIYEKLTTGEIQMVAQLLYSEARKDQFIWPSKPYACSYYALMSRTDYPNIATYQVSRAKVGVMKQSGKADIYRELFPENNDLIEFDTQNDCLDALERGEIDLLMASEYMLLTQVNYREKSGFKINIKFNASLDSNFGFHKDAAVLCSIIDKAQQYVQTDEIEINWTGRSFDYSKKLSEERTLYLTVFLCIMFFVLAVTVFVLVKNVRLSQRLKEIASHDALTGILNRRYFLEQASIQMARSLRLNNTCFLIIFDLDHFKDINDGYGHLAGDRVLKETAWRVKKSIRPYDLLGRYGGEEFIILMCDTEKENVINATERIRMEICKTPVKFENKEILVSASFGIASMARLNDLDTGTQYADQALYKAKEEGRNKVVYAGGSDHEGTH